jgi:hypothetical protein
VLSGSVSSRSSLRRSRNPELASGSSLRRSRNPELASGSSRSEAESRTCFGRERSRNPELASGRSEAESRTCFGFERSRNLPSLTSPPTPLLEERGAKPAKISNIGIEKKLNVTARVPWTWLIVPKSTIIYRLSYILHQKNRTNCFCISGLGLNRLETVLKPLTSQKMSYYERQTKGNF